MIDINFEAVGVIMFKGDSVLMNLRDDKPNIAYPGCWRNIGGGIDEGELPEQAAIRELKEETGYDINKKELLLFKVRLKFHGDKLVREYFFVAEYDGKQEINCFEGQKTEFKKVSDLDQLSKDGNKYTVTKEIYEIYRKKGLSYSLA